MGQVTMNSSALPEGTPHNELTPNEIDDIRDHWRSLNEEGLCHQICADLFIHIIQRYPHLKPIWPFGRKRYNDAEELRRNPGFINHVNNVVTAFNLCFTYLTNPKWLSHILRDIGSRHFYYDLMEPHFTVLNEALMAALRISQTEQVKFTNDLEQTWHKTFKVIQNSMQTGLASERINYLRTALTNQEMIHVAQLWEKVRTHGTKEAGISLCSAALHSYAELINNYGQDHFSISATEESAVFQKFATDTMEALDTTVTSYSPDTGFLGLPSKLTEYTADYFVTDVSPTVVRKALMEGLINMLTYVLGEVSMTEAMQRTWLKVYRVMEQAIIINILQL